MSLGTTASQPPPNGQTPPPQGTPSGDGSSPPSNGSPGAGAPPNNGQPPVGNGSPPQGNDGDWRAKRSGGDPDRVKQLARYATEDDWANSWFEQGKALSKRAEPPKLADNATPQQIAEWRKGLGVADIAADAKPDAYLSAYGIKAPDGYTMTQVEQGMIEGFAKDAYDKGMSPREVKAATDYFFKAQGENSKAVAALDKTKQTEWIGGLRDEWGRDFDAKVAAGEALLNQRFAEQPEMKDELLNAQLPGGGKLGDNPQFIKMIVDLALANGFTDRIDANTFESGGKSLAQQQQEIEALRFSIPERYNAPETQKKYDRILELRMSRGELDDQGNEVRRRRA